MIDKKKFKFIFRRVRFVFHVIGIIVSIVFIHLKDPGFYNVSLWMFGSFLAHTALLIDVVLREKGDRNVDISSS